MSNVPCTSYNCTNEFSIVKVNSKDIGLPSNSTSSIKKSDIFETQLPPVHNKLSHKINIYNPYITPTIKIKV